MAFHWDKLSPAEFQQLQDLAVYSARKLQDVLTEFCGSNTTPSGAPKYHPDGDIDYEGFRKFLDTYLEVSTPDELSRHLFLSFVKKVSRVDGKAFKEMAVLSSTTACAAITSHTTSSSNVNNTGLPGGTSSEGHSSSLADKIHGLTEKLQALGHHRTESEASTRARTAHLVQLSRCD